MKRIKSALGWGVMGWVVGALIGAVAGFVMGVVRIENAAQAALAGAGPVGLMGALGAMAGHLLERPSEGKADEAWFTAIFYAILGGLAGATIGKALGADRWLFESLAQVESESLLIFLQYHINLFGGPHVVVGAFLGILAFGFVDVFLGSESSLNALVIAAALTPVVMIVAALIGQIDWGTAAVIVVATVAIIYLAAKFGGGSAAAGSSGGGNSKGKGKPKP